MSQTVHDRSGQIQAQSRGGSPAAAIGAGDPFCPDPFQVLRRNPRTVIPDGDLRLLYLDDDFMTGVFDGIGYDLFQDKRQPPGVSEGFLFRAAVVEPQLPAD